MLADRVASVPRKQLTGSELSAGAYHPVGPVHERSKKAGVHCVRYIIFNRRLTDANLIPIIYFSSVKSRRGESSQARTTQIFQAA